MYIIYIHPNRVRTCNSVHCNTRYFRQALAKFSLLFMLFIYFWVEHGVVCKFHINSTRTFIIILMKIKHSIALKRNTLNPVRRPWRFGQPYDNILIKRTKNITLHTRCNAVHIYESSDVVSVCLYSIIHCLE